MAMAFFSHFLIASALLICLCPAYVELLWCHNGGTFNGKDCICPVGLNGRTCRSIETFASDTLNRSVEVNLVINEAFDDNYEDKASFEYKEFAGNFTHRMDIYYKENKIPHFKEVLITSISREGPLGRLSQNPVGEMRSSDEAIRTRADSVRVTHDVVLVISNNANSGPLYKSSFQAVNEAVGKLVDCPKDCPYPVTVQPIVKGTTLDVGSVCNKLVKDPIIAYYYESVPVDGTVTCATVCSSHHSSPKECYNEGLCRVHKDTGPICECQSVNSTWYLDKDCRFPIQKIPFYAGLSLTFFCLLMTVVGLTAYVLMGKHKQIQQTGDGQEKLDQWLYEDVEWVRSHSSTDIRNAGNRDSNPFSNSNPAFPHRDLFSNLSMSVSRPQIRPSCDA